MKTDLEFYLGELDGSYTNMLNENEESGRDYINTRVVVKWYYVREHRAGPAGNPLGRWGNGS